MASHSELEAFATKISNGPFGIALHKPEPWAEQAMCFANVLTKIERDGGDCVCGWMFQLKVPDIGKYFIAIHHAVWRAADGHLFDVTPLHGEKNNHPLMEDGGTLFLVDQRALPVRTKRLLAPLPSKFFGLSDSTELTVYLHTLELQENEACRKLYEGRQ
jgi:hypothetical protein